MSLATLKRKTSAKYNNVSVSNDSVFSLNGTRRIQGYVGQSLFGRYMEPCSCTNDNTVVKTSSINNKAQIKNKYKYIWRPQPFSSTKPDSTQNENTQGSYINFIKKNSINLTKNCINAPGPKNSTCSNDKACDYTKPESDYTSISSSKFVEILKSKCINNDTFYVPTNIGQTPFGTSI
jgi:hypothetical protein